MTIDLNAYVLRLPDIKAWVDARPGKDLAYESSYISVGTDIPIIAVCYMLIHLYGPNEQLSGKAGWLEAWYRVDKVILLRENV